MITHERAILFDENENCTGAHYNYFSFDVTIDGVLSDVVENLVTRATKNFAAVSIKTCTTVLSY